MTILVLYYRETYVLKLVGVTAPMEYFHLLYGVHEHNFSGNAKGLNLDTTVFDALEAEN